MEAFKKKKQQERFMGFLLGGLLILFGVVSIFLVGDKVDGPLAHALGFVTGAGCGIGAVMIVVAIKDSFALKSEEKLKALYIKSNDERLNAAKKNAFTVGGCISLVGLLIAAIIAQFFNQTVAITLIGSIYFVCLVLIVCKVIYVKRS